MNRFLSEFPNITPKDSRRAFNETERLIIWRRAGMICENTTCGLHIDFKDMHADHITPHSAGGKTIIENGQCLCATCNLSKSNR